MITRFKLFEYSNLNDNFWKWFGDSKIVENDKPLICYHGSPIPNIKNFDVSKIGYNRGNYGHYGYGIYFSTDIREAQTYGKNIYKCYIRMENPFYGTDEQILELKNQGVENIDDLIILSIDFDSFKESFRNQKSVFNFLTNVQTHDLEYAWNMVNRETDDLDLLNDISNTLEFTTLNKNTNGVPDYVLDDLKKWHKKPKFNRGFQYHQSLHWITDLGNRSKEVTDVIKKLGYDGVFYGSELVIFYPNQIKSTNNDGSWNNNNDIMS